MVSLIVHMKVKPGTEQECIRLMKLMEEHTRREPGCICYIGHQSPDGPTTFAFYEQYKTQKDLDDHWASDHFKKYVINGLDLIVTDRTKHLLNTIS
jgi:quinol monooxygenase YgiN